MKTYMDKEVLLNFMASKPNDQDDVNLHLNWQYLHRFLKTGTALFLNVDLNKEEKNLISPFVTILTSFGYSLNQVSCSPSHFRFKRKVDFQGEFSNADNLFFINESEKGELEKWKSRNGFYVACSEELMETWRRLNLTHDMPKSLPVRKFKGPHHMNSWNVLTRYKHPITDVIISDRYLLSNKELVEANLIPLIEALVSNRIAHFNATVFTSKNTVFDKDIKSMQAYLHNLFKSAGFNCTTIVVYDTVELFKEHDRHIITNYYHLSSGDSFTYFKKNGELKTNGTTLDIKPLVDPDYLAAAQSVLRNLKSAYDHPNIEKTDGKLNRLLSFSE